MEEDSMKTENVSLTTVDNGSEEDLEMSSEISLLKPEPSTVMDYRVRWIRDKVVKFLGLTDNYKFLFDTLINENNRFYEDKLLNLLILDLYGVMDLEKKQVWFYKTHRSEVVQEEIAVWEESAGHRVKITTLATFASKNRPQRLTKSAPGKVEKVEKVEEEKKKEKKVKKAKKTKKGEKSELSSTVASSIFTSVSVMQLRSDGTLIGESEEDIGEDHESEEEEEQLSGDTSLLQMKKKTQAQSTTSLRSVPFVPPPGEEDKYVLTKKVVDKVVEIPVLHMFFGEIDPQNKEMENSNLFYFMRTSEEGIPSFETYEDCNKRITNYLIVGSLNGNLLPAMNRLLVHAFKPLVENQFRGVRAAQQQIEEIHSGTKSGETPMGRATATLSAMIDNQATAFRRPSDYRRVSVMISKMEESGRISVDAKKSAEFQALKSSTESEKGNNLIETKKDESTPISSTSTDAKKEIQIESSKKDLLDYLEKLTTSVQWTLEHIEGDILLTVPRVSELLESDGTTSPSLAKKRVLEQLEKVVGSWGKHIQKVLDTFTKKVPQGKGPLAEYEYWHDRETGLSMLVEQLKTADVKEILSLLEESESPIASAFGFFQMELWKHYTEARDNNKFLFTVLRYFKLIAESKSFQAIAKALPPLTEGLRMIWVLSKYYSTEDKMVPLLERVSWQLCQNIMKNLAIEELFKY